MKKGVAIFLIIVMSAMAYAQTEADPQLDPLVVEPPEDITYEDCMFLGFEDCTPPEDLEAPEEPQEPMLRLPMGLERKVLMELALRFDTDEDGELSESEMQDLRDSDEAALLTEEQLQMIENDAVWLINKKPFEMDREKVRQRRELTKLAIQVEHHNMRNLTREERAQSGKPDIHDVARVILDKGNKDKNRGIFARLFGLGDEPSDTPSEVEPPAGKSETAWGKIKRLLGFGDPTGQDS